MTSLSYVPPFLEIVSRAFRYQYIVMYLHSSFIVVRVQYPNVTYKGKDKTEEPVKILLFL